jgi:circadian clock protein KaiC
VRENSEELLLETGIAGLDEVLHGGLVRNRMYLVEGDPGAGKTTMALQYLLAGRARGESCLFVTLSESEQELQATASAHGWDLEGIRILEVIASEESLTPDARYTMFHPSEVELSETTKRVLAEASRLQPSRIVLDSLSELRLLAENQLRYRRQILALKQHFSRQHSTVLFLDDRTGVDERDTDLHSITHGVVSLEREPREYGTTRRRLIVQKMRGRAFIEGYHDFLIRSGGVRVFPRLIASGHAGQTLRTELPSGIPELDTLLGGGLSRGTSTLVIGAAGTGKSSIAAQYCAAAAARGERSTIYLFDESVATFLDRSDGLGIPIRGLAERDRVRVRQIDPAELSPGEFADIVRRASENEDCKVVVLDSLVGYLNAMPSERFLALHLHELLSYLGQQGVTTILLMTQHGMVMTEQHMPIDASYLADTVLLLRYFEAFGQVRQAISVIKKRTGKHERTIRELRFDGGIRIGEPLVNFRGVLTGTPEYVGEGGALAQPAQRA